MNEYRCRGSIRHKSLVEALNVESVIHWYLHLLVGFCLIVHASPDFILITVMHIQYNFCLKDLLDLYEM